MCLPSCAVLPPIGRLFSPVACRVSTIPCRRVPCFRPSPGLFLPSRAVFPPLRAMSPPSPAVFLPFACRVSARRLPFFCPSPTVFLPSPAVAFRASTHRPAFSRRRLPCFYLSPAVFLPVACRVSARRLPSRAVLPPIARLSPPVACRASTHLPAFFRLRLPCLCPSPAMFLPVACHVSPIACRRMRCFPHRPAFLTVACHVSARRLQCSPHRLPSRAALPPIARLFSRRRLHCFIIKTKNCVCARNCHSECESVSRVHTLTLSHARTLTRSHTHAQRAINLDRCSW